MMASVKAVNVVVRLSAIDTATPSLRRTRYLLLTPIGRKVPPRGSMNRAALELHVVLRRIARMLVRDRMFQGYIAGAMVMVILLGLLGRIH